VPGHDVVKSVLVKARETFVLAVLPATHIIDLARLSQALGFDPDKANLASGCEIEAVFRNCEWGTIPPFGRLYELETVADASLRGAGVVAFGTSARHVGVRMHFRDYESLEQPSWADFAFPIKSGAGQSSAQNKRRAG
jgi:Ala-tRNA(Pro) deacylase